MASPFDMLFQDVQPIKRAGKGQGRIGSKNANAVVNEDQVRKIFHDKRPRPEIAKEYGLTVEGVKAIQLGYTWKHLKLTSE